MARDTPPPPGGKLGGTPDRARPTDRPQPVWRGSRRAWGVAIVVVCGLVAVALWRLPDRGPVPVTRTEVNRAVQSAIDHAQQEQRKKPPDAATAYRIIHPSLVTVTTERAVAGQADGAGDAGADGRAELGAGVVINSDGAILTALHIVDRGEQIRVRFADGTKASARVALSEAASDIAVLVVDRLPEVVVPAVMGGGAQVGDAVFPVGNPLGLRGSLTSGVVSAIDRSLRTDGGRTLTGLIQFDAAVNPGNSGGPLLNRNGHVIGIVTGLVNPSKQPYFVGVGFAVPIGTAGGVAGGPRQ
jgi:S1-C subfamily serine protease